MKQLIVFPFMILFYGFPPFIFKAKTTLRSKCERPVIKQEVKETRPLETETKYDKVFPFDNFFYKI